MDINFESIFVKILDLHVGVFSSLDILNANLTYLPLRNALRDAKSAKIGIKRLYG